MLSLSVVVGAFTPIFQPDRTTLTMLSLVTVLGSYSYTQPQYTTIPDWADTPLSVIEWDSFSVQDRVGMVSYADQQPTTSPMEAQYRAGEPLQVATVLAGDASVETLRHGGASDDIKVTGGPSTVQFYTYDFPGWQVRLDDQPLEHRHEPPFGLITVDVPAGEHVLELRMGTTPPRLIGSLLSLIALLIIGFGLWPRRYKTP
jgi:hypothetical protein